MERKERMASFSYYSRVPLEKIDTVNPAKLGTVRIYILHAQQDEQANIA
jgi:hypothetical protein